MIYKMIIIYNVYIYIISLHTLSLFICTYVIMYLYFPIYTSLFDFDVRILHYYYYYYYYYY